MVAPDGGGHGIESHLIKMNLLSAADVIRERLPHSWKRQRAHGEELAHTRHKSINTRLILP